MCMTLHEPDIGHQNHISCFKTFLLATSTMILGPVGIISNDFRRSLPWTLRWTVVSLLTFIRSEVKIALIFLSCFWQPVHYRWYSDRLLAGWYDVRFPAAVKELLFTRNVLPVPGTVRPAYLLDTGFISPWVKTIGVWGWPLSSV